MKTQFSWPRNTETLPDLAYVTTIASMKTLKGYKEVNIFFLVYTTQSGE